VTSTRRETDSPDARPEGAADSLLPEDAGPATASAGRRSVGLRIAGALALIAVALVFATAFRLPSHLTVDTGAATAATVPVTATKTLIQPLVVDGLSRVTAVEVQLTTRGQPANTTNDRLTVYDDTGAMVADAALPPGSVVDNTYRRLELKPSVTLDADARLFMALSSSDGSEERSIAACLNDSLAQSPYYILSRDKPTQGSPVADLLQARPRAGALCVRLYGLGPRALLAEKAGRLAGLLIGLLLAAGVFWAPRIRRRAGRAKVRLRSWRARASKRFAASPLSRLGRHISEDHLIRFDLKTQLLCLAGVILFAVLVAANVHYSSSEMWNAYLPPGSQDPAAGSLVLGKPKAIRSDEWLVSTPILLNTYTQPGGPSPARRVLDTASPWRWGFYTLGLERGFSFMWNFWYLGAFFSFFLLMLLLTRNQFAVSVLSALVMLFSAFNRWWDMTVIVTTFSVSVIALIYFLQARKLANIVASFVLLCIFALGFVVSAFYPAWQIPIGYLGLVLVVGFLAGNGFRQHLSPHLRIRVALAIFGVAAALAAILVGYRVNAESLQAMMNTVYPGHRVSTGGTIGFYRLFSGYLDPLFNEQSTFISNVCESSSFIFVYPIVLVLIVVTRLAGAIKRLPPLTIALAVYLLLLTFYVLVGFNNALARLTLLSYTPGVRALIGLGVGGIILTGLYLREPVRQRPRIWIAVLAGAIAFLALVAFAYGFGHLYTSEVWTLQWSRALLVCAVLAVAVAALVVRARVVFFAAMLLLVVVPTIGVIPVSRGLAPIYQKALVERVEEIVAAEPSARWLVYGSLTAPNIVRAAGASVFNGVSWPPETVLMRRLDPGGVNEDVWNRYAHITAAPAPPGPPSFSLQQTDAFTIALDPADDRLAAAGIRFFVAPSDAAQYFPASRFRKLTSAPLNGYDIYQRLER